MTATKADAAASPVPGGPAGAAVTSFAPGIVVPGAAAARPKSRLPATKADAATSPRDRTPAGVAAASFTPDPRATGAAAAPLEPVLPAGADTIDEDDEALAVGDPAATPGSARRIELVIEADAATERLDAALARRLAGDDLSRSRIKALVLDGRVAVGGRTVTDPSAKIAAGAAVAIDLPATAPAAPGPEPIPLAIVHEDAEVVVLDKPAGLVVHPAAGHASGTLVNALIAHCGTSLSGIGGVARPGIVHRLDKETSGLMVVAKTDRAHRSLAAQFADHGRTGPLERAYLAVVWGVPRQRSGTVDLPIGRNPRDRETMAVVHGAHGREAITHYEVLETYGPAQDPVASLVECRLETGRTHQIRVHMTRLGHPLLGDPTYGTGFRTKVEKLHRLAPQAAAALEALGRQALHARLLAFEHPKTGRTRRFESDPPADMAALIEALRSIG